MQKEIEKIINKFPPAEINNSRAIVRRKFESFYKSKSESKAMQIEAMTGETADFRDEDNEWSFRGEQIPR